MFRRLAAASVVCSALVAVAFVAVSFGAEQKGKAGSDKQYAYVVVKSDGLSSVLQGDPIEKYYKKKLGPEYWIETTRRALPLLSKDGWRIVRETAAGGNVASWLVLLEKDKKTNK